MRRVLLLLPAVTESMAVRSVDLLKEAGFDVHAAAFDRQHPSGRPPDCPVEMLGRISPGRYLARVCRLLRCVPRVRRLIRSSGLVIACSPDMLLLGLLAGVGLKKPMVLQMFDIRNIQVRRGWYAAALRLLDRFMVKRCRLLVLTTPGYYRYYQDWLKVEKPRLVLANKTAPALAAAAGDAAPPDAEDPPVDGRPVRIGWFGSIRDPWSMRLLEALTAPPGGRFTAVIAGSLGRQGGDYGGVEEFAERVERAPGIEFEGAFDYPDGLAGLYRSVDMVLDCYPPEIPHGWSQKNRFYEACLFRKPLIVRAGTGDADSVRRHDIGLIVDGDDAEQAAAQIHRVSAGDLRRWRGNMAALPPSVYAFTDEAAMLQETLTEIMDG